MKNVMAGVIVAVACMTSITVLTALHADTTAVVGVIMTGILPALGGLLYGKVEAINQQTNGNTSKLIALIDRQSQQLAASSAPYPLPEPPAAPAEDA